jgi:hypothetical protein
MDRGIGLGFDPSRSPRTSFHAKQSVLPIEVIKKTVVFIRGSYIENRIPKNWDGTAFFIYQSDPLLVNKGVIWLVTNKHMIRHPSSGQRLGPFFKKVTVRINTMKTAPERGDFEEYPVPVTDGAGDLLWCVAPDDSVDLALARVGIDEKLLDVTAVPTDQFMTPDQFKKLNINENDEVLFAGLFAAYRGIKRNFPIVRHGRLALITNERVPVPVPWDRDLTEELILAEVTTTGGNSGSPVFLRVGGIRDGAPPMAGYSYYLLGVMQGFFKEGIDFSLKITPLLRGSVSENSGIAAVIPADEILNILQTPRARALTLLTIANSYSNDGKYSDAERLFKESLSMSEKAVGPEHPDVADVLGGYAASLRKQNRTFEAFFAEARAEKIRAKANPRAAHQ